MSGLKSVTELVKIEAQEIGQYLISSVLVPGSDHHPAAFAPGYQMAILGAGFPDPYRDGSGSKMASRSRWV
ncbi:hypothetical protein GCM10011499_17960 [Pelagibacterium lentulum]|uniref:Uncharacterized protein n=1 Tax=Pelagibacterium lentulum TaxID=2029865 RepID=A0A916RAL3_9HYPH|nr:hypothetical protein GCM10011499_17960 [Pelagibacterium lentulum]